MLVKGQGSFWLPVSSSGIARPHRVRCRTGRRLRRTASSGSRARWPGFVAGRTPGYRSERRVPTAGLRLGRRRLGGLRDRDVGLRDVGLRDVRHQVPDRLPVPAHPVRVDPLDRPVVPRRQDQAVRVLSRWCRRESSPQLWKNPGDLTERQACTLAGIAKTNAPLYRAYLLKEQLRQVFQLKGAEGIALLDAWLKWAWRCRLPAFVKLARSIREHRAGINAALTHGEREHQAAAPHPHGLRVPLTRRARCPGHARPRRHVPTPTRPRDHLIMPTDPAQEPEIGKRTW